MLDEPASIATPPQLPRPEITRISDRRAQRAAELARAATAEGRVGNFAAAVTLVGGLATLVASGGGLPLSGFATFLIFLGVLLPLVVWRRWWSLRRLRRSYAVEWLDRALERLEDRWTFGQDDGERYSSTEHPYGRDLDLFGPASLFERLNATHTPIGSRALSDILASAWRSEPGGTSVRDRQDAVKELIGATDFREGLEVDLRILRERADRYAHELVDRATTAVSTWGAALPPPVPTASYALALIVLAGLAITSIVAFFGFGVSGWWVVPPLVLNAWVIRRTRDLSHLIGTFEVAQETLGGWARILARIEASEWQSPYLVEARAVLADGEASVAVLRLRRLADRLAQRKNLFHAVFVDTPLLVSLHTRRALLAWQRDHGPQLGDWFQAAATIEAVASLATYAEAVPHDPLPVIQDDGPVFRAEGLAHPLLPRATRVANDCELERDGTIWLVTGSNMSGKSTFLRAAGLAVVLAHAGVPVPAVALTMRRIRVVSTMRVEDSLREGSSRFHAEVTRLKRILDLAASDDTPAMVLLDEILAGTNSRERHLGTEAVLRALGDLPGVALVSTHDLALATLVGGADGRVSGRVVHFRDEVVEGRMIFDYRLREGPLPSTNALAVMRAVGLPVPPP